LTRWPKPAHTPHVIRPARVSSVLRFLLPAVWLVACAVPVAAKSYSADRFDVTAWLLSDRSLTIEERITFRFEGGDYTYVFREIPQDRTDGVRDLEAEMDGVPFRTGAGPGSIELKEGRSVRVTWRFAPTSGRHTFTLRYRLAGAITQEDEENVLAWRLLPSTHAYRIDQAHAVAALPPGASLMGRPSVRPAEGHVSVDYAPDGQAAERIVTSANDLGPDDSITLKLRLSPAGFTSTLPIWQREALERSRRGPWLLAVAAAVLVLGLSWLASFSSAWRRSDVRVHARSARAAAQPQPLLPVAIATRLAGASAGGPPFAATMVDLANRGVIGIAEAAGRRRLQGRRFVARLLRELPALRGHERAWIDVAFGRAGTHRSAEVPLERLQRQFARGRNAFTLGVDEEMRQAGLVDPERVAARGSLVRAAVLTVVLALAGTGVAIVLVSRFGRWAALIPGSLAVVATVYAIAPAAFRSSLAKASGSRRGGRRTSRRYAGSQKRKSRSPPGGVLNCWPTRSQRASAPRGSAKSQARPDTVRHLGGFTPPRAWRTSATRRSWPFWARTRARRPRERERARGAEAEAAVPPAEARAAQGNCRPHHASGG
jgi:hypothetical protein